MTLNIDAETLRLIARVAHKSAQTVGSQVPLAGTGARADDGAGGAQDSMSARSLSDAAHALNKALTYHMRRLDHFGDLATESATAYEATERKNSHRIANHGSSGRPGELHQIRPGG